PDSVFCADRYFVRLETASLLTDVAEFEQAIRAAHRAETAAKKRDLLQRAVTLYQGELLPGYYEDWVLAERNRLSELFYGVLRELLLLLEQEGDYSQAISYAQRAVQAAPLDEEVYTDLIRLCVASGQVSAAQRHYQELERTLSEALGMAPTRTFSQLLPSSLRPSSEIAYLLLLDIVGYSRLGMAEQARRVEQLSRIVRSSAEYLRMRSAGELIVLNLGDGLALVFFRDPQAPLQ